MWDTASFFQCSFIKACDSYLGPGGFADRALIVRNKAVRSSFQTEDLPEILRYNAAELVNLTALMGELRERLNKVGLRPSRWDGPGAIASALLKREGIPKARAKCPDPVALAGRFAYAGGRFEVIRFGSVDRTDSVPAAYEYDINSAYPAALRDVPNLQRGHWAHFDHDPGSHPFAVYHIDYTDRDYIPSRPHPLFCRRSNGAIAYPPYVQGWYWSPEVDMLRDYCRHRKGKAMRVIEAWVFVADNEDDKPFAFIDGLYAMRRALKLAKDGAESGLKQGLNSLYGKLAQQVGYRPAHHEVPERIPPFHQLEWAGYVTSHCRAKVFRAAMQDLDSVIAFETDALFTSKPLDLPLGSNLGEWEGTEFASLAYVQSGLYFARSMSGQVRTAKTRGIDLGSLTLEDVLAGWANPIPTEQTATAALTRFNGAGIGLRQSWSRWRRWETVPKVITLQPAGKRDHIAMPDFCRYCPGSGPKPLRLGVWHETHLPILVKQHSSEFPIAWINPDPEMTELEEMRQDRYESDYE